MGTHPPRRTTVLAALLVFATCRPVSFAQELTRVPSNLRAAIESASSPHTLNVIPKRLGHYTADDWAEVIDATWGNGLPTSRKLEVFDLAWKILDENYGAYHNLEVDLDAIRTRYRPEIESGVSRGRFAAIMNHMSLAMKSAHTTLMDRPVNWGTRLGPGVPLFVIGAFRDNAHFGAALTPLPDSSLVVYRVIPNHRIGLERGDIILGYDGVPWKTLYRELLEAELPIRTTWVWGSTDDAITHEILCSAGMNWHLFDTIDVVKYSTGDTLSIPTLQLDRRQGRVWGNEQLDVPGVTMPDIANDDFVSWGIVSGTNTGYVYVASMDFDPQYEIGEKFYQAVHTFMYEHDTDGIIIDYRLNYGGGIEAERAYQLLYDRHIYTIAYDLRGDPGDHYSMRAHSQHTPFRLSVRGSPQSYYDKPIAILTGPATVSAGDVESYRISFHPMARFFGKPSSGALSISSYPDLGDNNWFFYLSTGSAYLVDSDPKRYLVHDGIDVDEEVWLTQEDVVRGEDTVAKAAIEWIRSVATNRESPSFARGDLSPLVASYPNPATASATISYHLPESGRVVLTVHDTVGREIEVIVDRFHAAGEYNILWAPTALTSGVYVLTLESEARHISTKLTFLR